MDCFHCYATEKIQCIWSGKFDIIGNKKEEACAFSQA